ncbi:MAG: DNA primase [Bacteroidetes bacterium]|nr:DNA primase [Bacteroidota bacterium]MBL7103907.1 DNA primase [Bacteroidales bacterium]
MITKDTIQTIIETARVEEVIGDFVTLRKRGVNYVGLCPFHNEKTPSFTVSPAKGIYKCFGCGKAGNPINFVMDHEHYSYPEALRYLAKKYNIEIEEEEQTPEQLQELNEKESLYSVSAFAQKYFTDRLNNSEEGKAIGLSYFKNRDFREHTIEKFQLGYSPDSWDAFTKYALENGYKEEYLIKSGLTIDKNGKRFDRFSARVIFPIHNLSGRVIGFGGRILKSAENKPKYVNSPESDIYNKSKVLYGIYFAKSAVISKDNCYLVEGYTDVISLHQAGFENVVASSGTSLTTDQIRLIKRYTPNITILFDGDEAGLKASFRGIDMILEQGMNVKIVMFPEGEDPDSYVRNHRSIEVEEFLTGQTRDFIQFKTNILLKETKDDPVKKAGLIKEIVQTISLIPDQITRSVYIKECSVMMDIEEQTLMNELNKLLRKKFREKDKQVIPVELHDVYEFPSEQKLSINILDTYVLEKDLTRILLNYGRQKLKLNQTISDDQKEVIVENVAKFIINDLKSDGIEFSTKTYNLILQDYDSFLEKDEVLTDNYFVSHKNSSISSTATDLLLSKYYLSENWEIRERIFTKKEDDNLYDTIYRLLIRFKDKKLDQKFFEIETKLREEFDDNKRIELQKEYIEYKKISMEINRQLGRVITR